MFYCAGVLSWCEFVWLIDCDCGLGGYGYCVAAVSSVCRLGGLAVIVVCLRIFCVLVVFVCFSVYVGLRCRCV